MPASVLVVEETVICVVHVVVVTENENIVGKELPFYNFAVERKRYEEQTLLTGKGIETT